MWDEVSTIFGKEEPEDLIFKWKNILKSATQEEYWRKEEDSLLLMLYRFIENPTRIKKKIKHIV